MYLKSLEMQGFKSFPDRTKLTFEQGATVIIGPNGSGKSNISDAMRWVLGEISTKSIRGSKMEDIIFGGADSRRPMGFAEVSVTFDNTEEAGRIDCPYDEVTVTRKYFRGGESEYYINKKPCRLRDIYELFMNTGVGRDGYSIIGQGKIAEMISKKDDERRGIFEDAAGIAKYRHKKNESERHLAQTQQNMERAADILAELESRIGPLERECVKAKRYVEYYDIKKEADVRLWLYDTEKLREKIRDAEQAYKESTLALEHINEELDTLAAREETLSREMMSSKLLSEQLNEKVKARMTENYELDKSINLAKSDISHTKELLSVSEHTARTLEEEVKKNDLALAEAVAAEQTKAVEIQRLEEEKARIEGEAGALITEIASIKDKIANAFADMTELEHELAQNIARKGVLESSGSADVDKHTAISSEIERFEGKNAQLKEKIGAIESTIADYDRAIATEKEGRDAAAEKLSAVRTSCAAAEEEAKELSLRVDMLSQRIRTLKSMEEQFEGYHHSVRFIMREYKEERLNAGTIYGPLSSLISVDAEYLTAVETALGASLQHIVVDNEETAKAAISALKRAKAGRTTFYPVTSMSKGAQRRPEEVDRAQDFVGYIGRGSELASFDERFTPVVESLLGRTVVFDNIENASAMAKALRYKVRAVTLDGQQINIGGSFTGGSVKQDNSLLSRSGEIGKLTDELSAANVAYDKTSKKYTELTGELSSLENEILSLDERIKLLDTMRASEEADRQGLLASLSAEGVLLDNLKEDLLGLSTKKKQVEEELVALDESCKAIREKIEAIREYREDTQIKLAEKEEELTSKNAEMTDLRIASGIAAGELESKAASVSSTEQSLQAAKDRLMAERVKASQYNAKIAFLEGECEDNREALSLGEKELEALTLERARTEEGSMAFEQKMNALRVLTKEKNDARDAISSSHIRNENNLNQLVSEQDATASTLWDDYQLTRADALALGYDPVDESNRAEIRKVQIDYRNKLRAMGSVNVGAIDEYKEVKERYDELKAQMTDLEKSQADLLRVIRDLESEMRVAFRETFDKINENFGKVFSELFGGGSAELILTDPDDVLTSGIEIKAAPPGKIIKSLVQLSGGEQSFVAIALFFAILSVNPTPFCILDEIEAALDEVNVDRFANYISRYSGDTQFILITHRRGTMDAADILYGVTMPERGISKVLTLNVEEVSKTKGEEWDGIFG